MDIAGLLKQETIGHLETGLGRIHRCSGMLSNGHIWHRPNEHVVSIGNLILHLGGNVRQYIMATMGGERDERQRNREFTEAGPMDRVRLMGDLDRTIQQAKIIISSLDECALERLYKVQVFEHTGVGILMHVAEHFSYHVGQITLHTKLLLNVDTGYYQHLDL